MRMQSRGWDASSIQPTIISPPFGAMINASMAQRASLAKTSARAASWGAASMTLRGSRGVSGSARPSALPYKR